VGGIQTPALHVRVPGLSERSAWSLTLSLDYALATSVHATHANIKRVSKDQKYEKNPPSIDHLIPVKSFEFSKSICANVLALATLTPHSAL
jgi:hypothetical protein